MMRTLEAIRRVATDEEGTAEVEYKILLGAFVLSIIAFSITIGAWTHT
jgi:Flp pilus assembly pilin Flp